MDYVKPVHFYCRLLRYEDLVVDVKGTVEQLFAFVGLQVPSVIKRGIFPRRNIDTTMFEREKRLRLSIFC